MFVKSCFCFFVFFLSDSGHGDIQIIQNDTKSDFFFFLHFYLFGVVMKNKIFFFFHFWALSQFVIFVIFHC